MSSGRSPSAVELPPVRVDVRVRHVDLVDRDDDLDLGGLGVADRLLASAA